MAQFCFAEQKRALFTEACLRGWWQACVDFPQPVTEASLAAMWSVPDLLRAEVCCIGEQDIAYRTLVLSAYGAGYNAHETATERAKALMVLALKGMSWAEGMTLLRHGMSSRDGQALIDKAYAQLCAAMPMFK